MEQPIVLVDVDGVLADLCGKWLREYQQRFGITLHREQVTKWDWNDFLPPGHAQALYAMLKEPGFFIDGLLPIPGAQDAITRLSSHVRLVALTNVPRVAVADRARWLRWYFPEIREIAIAKQKDCVWGHVRVDDYPPNLIGAGDYVLVDQPYNREDTGTFYRAMNWQQAEQRIFQLLLDQGWLL